jgi:hypothetical protein
MVTIATGDGTEIYFRTGPEGQPVVFSHGWPMLVMHGDDDEIVAYVDFTACRPREPKPSMPTCFELFKA